MKIFEQKENWENLNIHWKIENVFAVGGQEDILFSEEYGFGGMGKDRK